eukprot:5506583-Amphidinium_carterae.1
MGQVASTALSSWRDAGKGHKGKPVNARIYACPLCPMKYESSQQRYLHCGLDHLVYIPMVEGAPQSATN